ncbi:DUF2905 domain-containing protein [Haloferula sp.]|uniref:DUF2905 domain-containing protein n=1 Tax=Haloferula sp. TaxID=2497595 RepID=UPI00329F9C34
MPPLVKILLITGLSLTALGLVLWMGGRWFGWLGKLPGDIRIENDNNGFYFPITTCIVISVVLSLIAALVRKFG